MKSISRIAEDATKARQALDVMNIGDAKERLDRVIAQLTSHPMIYVSVDDEQWARDMKKVIEDASKPE